jgi:hypothetical protein
LLGLSRLLIFRYQSASKTLAIVAWAAQTPRTTSALSFSRPTSFALPLASVSALPTIKKHGLMQCLKFRRDSHCSSQEIRAEAHRDSGDDISGISYENGVPRYEFNQQPHSSQTKCFRKTEIPS